MPSIRVAQLSAALTAQGGTDGYATFTANAGFLPGAYAWLSKADGSLQRKVLLTDLSGTTKVGCRIVPEYAGDLNAKHPSYGRSDLSAFPIGSFLTMYPQVVLVDAQYTALQNANVG